MIDETKLVAVIKHSKLDVVNLNDNNFEYSDGHIIAICNYNNYKVINTLFTKKSILNMRDWKPIKTSDLSKMLNCEYELEAVNTGFIKSLNGREYYIYKIADTYYSFNKRFVDVFNHVHYYKANVENGTAILRVYESGELQGVILMARMDESNQEVLANIIGQEE